MSASISTDWHDRHPRRHFRHGVGALLSRRSAGAAGARRCLPHRRRRPSPMRSSPHFVAATGHVTFAEIAARSQGTIPACCPSWPTPAVWCSSQPPARCRLWRRSMLVALPDRRELAAAAGAGQHDRGAGGSPRRPRRPRRRRGLCHLGRQGPAHRGRMGMGGARRAGGCAIMPGATNWHRRGRCWPTTGRAPSRMATPRRRLAAHIAGRQLSRPMAMAFTT